MIFRCYFSYHAHRGNESFDTHVWILKTLLERAGKSEDDLDTFFHYIIAVSFQKMNARMTNKHISTTYYGCLQNLTTFPYLGPIELRAGRTNHDKLFIEAIPSFKGKIQTKIPNLEAAAKVPNPREIYNENTCIEFHLLLCELLSKFKNSLENLRDEKKKKASDPLKALKKVRIIGHFLRTMVRSSAIEAHLQNIASSLVVDPRKEWTPVLEDIDDPDLADFQRLEPFSMRKGRVLFPWESYRDWLMLLMHYFDAADVLVWYAQTWKPKAISISILSPPQPDRTMLPWTELLETERFFPTVFGQSSGKDFVKFLTSMPPMSKEDIKVLREVSKGIGELESFPYDQLDERIDALAEQFKERELLERQDFDIHEEILALKQSEDRRAQIQKIVDMLSIFTRRALFYNQLKEGPIITGKNAPGTYHCEAYTASLLTLWDTTSGQLVGDFKERLNTSAHDIEGVEALLEKLKASHAFINRSNLC